MRRSILLSILITEKKSFRYSGKLVKHCKGIAEMAGKEKICSRNNGEERERERIGDIVQQNIFPGKT